VEHLSRENTKAIDPETTLYFKDLTDHTIQVLDSIDTYMQLLSSMMDTYVSSLSNKMTDVLKVLTIIATVFTPPTFVASIYGMNFIEVMPELHHLWVYLLVWGVMLGMIGAMLFWFWRRGWFKSLQLMNVKRV
jgi:magnesium transporter